MSELPTLASDVKELDFPEIRFGGGRVNDIINLMGGDFVRVRADRMDHKLIATSVALLDTILP